MYIESVQLKKFRSYDQKTVEFKEGLNIIVGENASGKTNLLESIYCCGIGKSPRTNKYKDMVKWGEGIAYIKVTLRKHKTTHTIEFSIDSQEKKENIYRRYTSCKAWRYNRFFEYSFLFSRRDETYKRKSAREKKIFRYKSFSTK